MIRYLSLKLLTNQGTFLRSPLKSLDHKDLISSRIYILTCLHLLSGSPNEPHMAPELVKDCDDASEWMFQHLSSLQPHNPQPTDILQAIHDWSTTHRSLIREIVELDPTLAFRMHNTFCNVCGTVMHSVTHNTARRIPSITNIVIRDATRLRDALRVSNSFFRNLLNKHLSLKTSRFPFIILTHIFRMLKRPD